MTAMPQYTARLLKPRHHRQVRLLKAHKHVTAHTPVKKLKPAKAVKHTAAHHRKRK